MGSELEQWMQINYILSIHEKRIGEIENMKQIQESIRQLNLSQIRDREQRNELCLQKIGLWFNFPDPSKKPTPQTYFKKIYGTRYINCEIACPKLLASHLAYLNPFSESAVSTNNSSLVPFLPFAYDQALTEPTNTDSVLGPEQGVAFSQSVKDEGGRNAVKKQVIAGGVSVQENYIGRKVRRMTYKEESKMEEGKAEEDTDNYLANCLQKNFNGINCKPELFR